MFLACTITGYSVSLFTPTIVRGFGWSALRTQVMTIPIYVTAGVCCIVIALLSDRARHRYSFAVGMFSTALIGYAILLRSATVSTDIRYMAIFFAAAGSLTALPISIAWTNNNMGGHYKKSIAAGLQIGLGNVGGIIASNVFLTREAPTYSTGYSVNLAAIGLGIMCCTIHLAYCALENRKRDQGERDYRLQLPPEQLTNLGDDHPEFRFTY